MVTEARNLDATSGRRELVRIPVCYSMLNLGVDQFRNIPKMSNPRRRGCSEAFCVLEQLHVLQDPV